MQQEWMGGATREDGQIPLDGFLRMMEAMKIHGMKSGAMQLHAMGDPSCGR